MGDVVLFPRDRAVARPVATTLSDESRHILDQVELPGEPMVDGPEAPSGVRQQSVQRGIIERLMLDGIAGMFWVRLTGGPRGGTVLVVDGSRLARPRPFLPPLSHG